MTSTSISDSTPSLQEALRLQQSGDERAAETMYRVILETNPACADAWHLLGLIALQQGAYERAIEYIRTALRHDPAQAGYHYNLAHVYKRHDKLPEAAASYRAALALRPDDGDTLNNLGGVLLDLGEAPAAVACFAQALQINPRDAQIHCNSGHALLAVQQTAAALQAFCAALALDEAYVPAHHALAVVLQQQNDYAGSLRHYQRALFLQPDNPALHLDLGTWYQAQDRLADAAACYQNAITLDVTDADAWNNLGAVQQAQGELQHAVHSYSQALHLAPEFASAHKNLASAHHLLGERELAVEHYRAALHLQPDYAEAAYELAALTGDTHAAPPPGYVANLFDQYAYEYDTHMIEVLGYNVPRQLRALLAPHLTPPLTMLDLGCGTGLSGALFHDLTRHLAGIDVSPKMLEHARARAIYQQLIVGDVVAATSNLTASFDLILAADVFVYLGDLDPVFAAVWSKLTAGGWFAFSVERGSGDNYALRNAGRYAHAPSYIHTLIARHGFSLRAEQSTVLRKDYGHDVAGSLWLLKKNPSA